MKGGLGQRQVEQRGQSAAGADLRAGPVGIVWLRFARRYVELAAIEPPDAVFLSPGWQVEEEDAIKTLCPRELRRQFGNVVASANHEDIAFVIAVG